MLDKSYTASLPSGDPAQPASDANTSSSQTPASTVASTPTAGSPPPAVPPMTYRFVGRSGLQMSALSLGSWITFGGHIDEAGTFECMKAAYDCGINTFDCAENYNNGEAEKVIGAAIRKFGWKRNDLVISTKIYWGTAHSDNPVNNKGLSRKHVIEGMDGCLERLGLRYVDLVYAHRPDRHTPVEETVRAFNHLIDTGRTLYWGTSEWSADEIAQAWRVCDRLGLAGPIVEQPAYNMLDRERVEREYAHLCREDGMGLTVYSPMARGLLSGKYKHGIPEGSRLSMNNVNSVRGFWAKTNADKWEALMAQVGRLEPLADRLACQPGQLALAWCLKHPQVASAVMGASSKRQVYENVRSVEIAERISPDMMGEIDEIFGNKPPAFPKRY